MNRRIGFVLLLSLAAVACYEKKPTGYEPDPRALELNNSAVAALQRQDLNGALESVDKAIAADPQFYNAYANKGAILTELGRDKDAIAAFRKAITLNPDFADAYVPLGTLYEKEGKTPYAKKHYALAVRLYRSALEKEPENPRIAANLAVALFLSDDRTGALDYLSGYLAKHPGDETIARVKSKIENRDRDGLVRRPSAK